MNTAEITIIFTSSYTGNHRICYRITGDTDYICIIVSCQEGEQCEFTFPIETINEGCNAIIIEGYIQPLCEDLSSEGNRIPWEVELISTDPCKRYSIDCVGGYIGQVTVTDSGTAIYDPMNPPNLIISEVGGIGYGGQLTPVIDNISGLIIDVTIDNPGGWYGNTTTITVDSGTGTLPTFEIEIRCNSSAELLDCSDIPQILPTLTMGIPYNICTNETISDNLLDDAEDLFVINRQELSCSCNCLEYAIENTSPFLTLPFRYYDCNGVYNAPNILPSTTVNLCIGTYGTYLLSDFIEVTLIGPCP